MNGFIVYMFSVFFRYIRNYFTARIYYDQARFRKFSFCFLMCLILKVKQKRRNLCSNDSEPSMTPYTVRPAIFPEIYSTSRFGFYMEK